MLVHTFACDICLTQNKKIYQVKFEISTAIMNNGDMKPTMGAPLSASCEICSEKCALEALTKTFKKMEVKTIDVRELEPESPIPKTEL